MHVSHFASCMVDMLALFNEVALTSDITPARVGVIISVLVTLTEAKGGNQNTLVLIDFQGTCMG